MTRHLKTPHRLPAQVQAFARASGMARLSTRAMLLVFQRHNLDQAERLALAVDSWADCEAETRDDCEGLSWAMSEAEALAESVLWNP